MALKDHLIAEIRCRLCDGPVKPMLDSKHVYLRCEKCKVTFDNAEFCAYDFSDGRREVKAKTKMG